MPGQALPPELLDDEGVPDLEEATEATVVSEAFQPLEATLVSTGIARVVPVGEEGCAELVENKSFRYILAVLVLAFGAAIAVNFAVWLGS